MPLDLAIQENPEFRIPYEQRDLDLWKQLCLEALLFKIPEINACYRTIADEEWGVFQRGPDQRLKSPTVGSVRFPDNVFSLLFVWSVEHRLWSGAPTSTVEELRAQFLHSAFMSQRGFIQSWANAQLGPTALVNAATSTALGNERLNLETGVFHLACEAEMLRRIRQAWKMKGSNDAISLEELLALRKIHAEAKDGDLTGALQAVKQSNLYESPQFRCVVTEHSLSETIQKWAAAFRIRCRWAEAEDLRR